MRRMEPFLPLHSARISSHAITHFPACFPRCGEYKNSKRSGPRYIATPLIIGFNVRTPDVPFLEVASEQFLFVRLCGLLDESHSSKTDPMISRMEEVMQIFLGGCTQSVSSHSSTNQMRIQWSSDALHTFTSVFVII
jgi:hypothetical protein